MNAFRTRLSLYTFAVDVSTGKMKTESCTEAGRALVHTMDRMVSNQTRSVRPIQHVKVNVLKAKYHKIMSINQWKIGGTQ